MNRPRFHAPGYDPVQLLGSGASAEVWLAREIATGDPVAVKLLRSQPAKDAADHTAAVAAMQREAILLAGLEHEHLIRLRRAVPTGDGLLLVLDFAGGGSLASLLRRRGTISAGEIVTTTAPIASALAVVHDRGVVHGDVSPSNILFTTDGRPVLADLGVSKLVGEAATEVSGTRDFVDPAVLGGQSPSPASDVFGLAAVGLAALTGGPVSPGPRVSAPGAERGARHGSDERLLAVLRTGLDPDPARRPSAAAFATALFDAVAPAPVRLPSDPVALHGHTDREVTRRVRPRPDTPSPGSGPAVRRSRRKPPDAGRRRWLGTALVVAGVIGLLGFAVARATQSGVSAAAVDGPRSPAVPSIGPVPVTPAGSAAEPDGPSASERPDWRAVVDRLDSDRSRAFATGDEPALSAVYASGAPAFARDRAMLRQLISAGARARGLRLDIRTAEPLLSSADRVILRVSDQLPAYSVVDVSGSVIERRPGRGETTWEVTLIRAGGRWLMFDVVRTGG